MQYCIISTIVMLNATTSVANMYTLSMLMTVCVFSYYKI